MGKKRVVEKTEKELLEEREKIEEAKKEKKGKVKRRKSIDYGCIYISASYNNTMMNITDREGRVLAWASAGSLGFKGTKKATPFAASEVAGVIAEKAEKLGVKEVDIYVKGVGTGRSSALRALASRNMTINSIKDITPIPHNGCRPRKARRV